MVSIFICSATVFLVYSLNEGHIYYHYYFLFESLELNDAAIIILHSFIYLIGVTISPPMRSDTGGIIVHVGVPEAMLGTVIGRGGVIIKDIISETGANIRVSILQH